MGNQPYEQNPARERSGGNRPPTIANLPAVPVPVAGAPRPAVGSHQCPNCGAWAPAGSSVCAECGTRLQTKPQKIRCRLCDGQAQASLVICPHCGRELHPAPSRVLTWGAPTILVLLFLLVLVQRWESGNPFRWLQHEFAQGRAWVDQMAQQLDPQITISTLPAGVTENSATDGVPALLLNNNQENSAVDPNNIATDPTPVSAETSSSVQAISEQGANAPVEQATTGVAAVAVVTPTATLTEAPATTTAIPSPPPTVVPTTPAPTPTSAPATPLPVASATPTSLATMTATSSQPTLSAIVQSLPIVTTAEAVTSANVDSRKSQTTTTTILQPTPTDLPTQTATPNPTPAPVTYVVKAGDTPLEIASQFGISVDTLLALNGLSVNDARRLRVGQVLTIGAAETTAQPTATLTPTSVATATATTSPTPTTVQTPVATNTPAATTRVDAPVLRSPENGSSLSCSGNNSLIWLPVSYIRDNDQYLLHLGFLNGQNGDGSEQVTWILEQWRPANVTLWDLDEGLCGLAPQAYGRQWRWYVEVVEATGSGWRPVSPPSAIGGFSWN